MVRRRDRLAQRRKVMGLSQERLAEVVGVDRSTVVRWERADTDPQPWYRMKLARALRVGAEELAELLADVNHARSRRSKHVDHVDGSIDVADVPDGRSGHDPNTDDGQPDGFDLWEFNDVLRGKRVGREELTRAEEACARLDTSYAGRSPAVVLPEISVLLRKAVRAMREPQTVDHRRRLCALAGRLAGLRAWLLFDLADHRSADLWYEAAIQAAREAEDHALGGWLLGARSLIPSYQHNHRAALDLIACGQAIVEGSGDKTVKTWLNALEARSRAGMHDLAQFRTARRHAERLVARTALAERRHGMDFDGDTLDLTYYTGSSYLLLRQPEAASTFLRESIRKLPPAHAKATAILLLGLATAAAQRHDVDEAGELMCQALATARNQPIMPILLRARELRNQLPTSAGSLTNADECLTEFAHELDSRQPGSLA